MKIRLASAVIIGTAILGLAFGVRSGADWMSDINNAFTNVGGNLEQQLHGAWDQVANLGNRINELTREIEAKTGIISTLQNQVNAAGNAMRDVTSKVQDLTNKVNATIQGVGITMASIADIGTGIQKAVETIKAERGQFDGANTTDKKMVVVAKMIDDLIPAIRAIKNGIATVGTRLIDVYDKQKGEQTAHVAQEFDNLIGVVDEINKLLVELSKTVSLVVK